MAVAYSPFFTIFVQQNPVGRGGNHNTHTMGALSERASLLETTVGAPGRTEAGFTIRVAADVGVQKVNVEVTFAAHPTSLPALIAALQASFIWDWHGDGHVHPIDVSHILLWGDLDHEWRYLCHHNDLAPADQIYLFQKYQTTYTPGALPAPRVRIHAGEPINFREQGRVRVAADMFGRKVNYNIRYVNTQSLSNSFFTDMNSSRQRWRRSEPTARSC